MTDEEKKLIWERGKNVLEIMLKHVSIEKLEALGEKMKDKSFRESIPFKMFMKTLT